MNNEVPDWVHDRFHKVEDNQREMAQQMAINQREMIQQIAVTNQQLAVNTTTVKAFGEQMKAVVDLFLEKLEDTSEISYLAIESVKEDNKKLDEKTKKLDEKTLQFSEEIKLLKTGEHKKTKWADWIRTILGQIIIIVITALVALHFGGK